MFFKKNKKFNNSPFSRLREAENLPETRKEEFKIYTKEYLSSDNWKIRNVGVKLIGMLGFKDMIPELIRLLTDRIPDKFFNRLLGGDFVQVGFIRRNCIRSLIILKESNSMIKGALYRALDDPYWEVRAEAIRAISELFPDENHSDMERRLIELLNDKEFEVILLTIEILGKVSNNKDILKDLRKLYYHPNQKVRRMLIVALNRLFSRGIIKDEKELNMELNQIFIHKYN
jgi:UDP-N-acetylglucosamine--N-acetylmuramyl-(pentapeptide) pyrophosphoryl-undecaprenol N-acetylglucosamine transferase